VLLGGVEHQAAELLIEPQEKLPVAPMEGGLLLIPRHGIISSLYTSAYQKTAPGGKRNGGPFQHFKGASQAAHLYYALLYQRRTSFTISARRHPQGRALAAQKTARQVGK